MPPARPGPRHLVVIGLRASGKTSAGELAAGRLGLAFQDLDELAMRNAPGGPFTSVRALFEAVGEAGFRQAETKALEIALDRPQRGVLALGGGTAAFPEAGRVLMRAMEAGAVLGPVYLHASPGVLARRLRLEVGDRPSLTGEHPADEIAGLYDQRDALYRVLAAEVVEVDHLSVDQTADRLVEIWHALDRA